MHVCDDNETKRKREKDILHSDLIKMCGGFFLMISIVIFLKKIKYKLTNNKNKKSIKLTLDGFFFK